MPPSPPSTHTTTHLLCNESMREHGECNCHLCEFTQRKIHGWQKGQWSVVLRLNVKFESAPSRWILMSRYTMWYPNTTHRWGVSIDHNSPHRIKLLQLVQDLFNFYWFDMTPHPPTHPPTHQPILPPIGRGVSTDYKSSNGIEISRISCV